MQGGVRGSLRVSKLVGLRVVKWGVLLVLLAAAVMAGRIGPVSAAGNKGRIAFVACVAGNWDIYSVAADGTDLRRLTTDPADDLDPAWSPDGTRLAFISRRDGYWNLYVLDVRDGRLTRLMANPHYDGAPAWSPDGQWLAFESSRAGDLDIWMVGADGVGPVNLTPDSPFGDAGPAWSPDGQTIAFTSWRYGDRDIFLLDIKTLEVVQFTSSPATEERPAWSPDGARLAFVAEPEYTREVYVADVAVPPADKVATMRLTWLARDDAFAWSPDGGRFAAVWRRLDGDQLLVHRPGAIGKLPLVLAGPAMLGERVSWGASALPWGEPVTALGAPEGPFEESLVHPGPPYERVYLQDVDADLPKLSDVVDGSYNALRHRVFADSGHDFLGRLSEAIRPLDFYSDASAYASWHKAGRAFDTMLDFSDRRGPLLELAREDVAGDTYWRVYLRCARQDGSQGRPLTISPWDHTYEGREVRGKGQGGTPEPLPHDYYTDFTALARFYGWQRIPAHDADDFHWYEAFKAMEYWHFQKMDGLTWYQAMLQVWAPEIVTDTFAWETMVEKETMDPWLVALKGVPLPATAGHLQRLREQ
jgi:TolB protein